jgi:hypothetical protein
MEFLTKVALITAALITLALGGCRAMQSHDAPASQPAESSHSGALPSEAAQSSAALMEYIGDQPYVTQDAGYRAAYTLWRGASFTGSFDALAEELRGGHIIGRSWRDDPQRLLTRIHAGYMVCRATGIKSGLNWRLFGHGRYAWRELIYREIAQPSSEMNYISGGEFLGVITRADEYAAKRGRTPAPNLELGPRPD